MMLCFLGLLVSIGIWRFCWRWVRLCRYLGYCGSMLLICVIVVRWCVCMLVVIGGCLVVKLSVLWVVGWFVRRKGCCGCIVFCWVCCWLNWIWLFLLYERICVVGWVCIVGMVWWGGILWSGSVFLMMVLMWLCMYWLVFWRMFGRCGRIFCLWVYCWRWWGLWCCGCLRIIGIVSMSGLWWNDVLVICIFFLLCLCCCGWCGCVGIWVVVDFGVIWWKWIIVVGYCFLGGWYCVC